MSGTTFSNHQGDTCVRTHVFTCVRTYSIVACKLTSWRPNQYAWVLDDYVRTYVRRRLPTYAWILSYIGEHTLEDPVCLEQCPMFCIRTCHYVHSPANSSMLSGSLFMYVCVSIFPFFIFAKPYVSGEASNYNSCS